MDESWENRIHFSCLLLYHHHQQDEMLVIDEDILRLLYLATSLLYVQEYTLNYLHCIQH